MFRKALIARCLTLLVLALLSTNLAWGAEKTLTFDLSKNPGNWPTANSTTLTNYTYTLDGVDYTFGLKNVKCNSGYLMLTSTAVLGLPAIEGYKLTKVVAKNSSGCSISTIVGISSSASSASYITGGAIQTWSTISSSYTYNLSDTKDNTVYYLYVTNKNAQVVELTLTYEGGSTPSEPYLSVSPNTIDFGIVYQNADVDAEEVTVTFGNLTENDVEADTDDVTTFDIDKTHDFISGDKIKITPITNGLGDYEETLRLFSETDGIEATVTITMEVVTPPVLETYNKVTNISDLAEGDIIVLASGTTAYGTEPREDHNYIDAMKFTDSQSASLTGNVLKAADAYELTLAKSGDNWTMTSVDGLVGTTAAKTMTFGSTASGNVTTWSISIDGSANASITSTTSSYGTIKYNSSSPRFLNYASGQNAIQLYKKVLPSPTSISVKTAPTKTTYFVGETFAPAGLVITANYDSGDPEDIAYTGNESKFSFEPNLETALTTANDKVTITYGGKSCDQAITVNLNKLATPTNLQATNVTSTSATLTWDAVENASSYDVKLSGKTRTSETNSLLVENLTESTAYTWTVKAKGDGTTYEDSEESTTNEFTTLAPPTVTYTVTFNGNEHGTPASESITETEAGAGITLPEVTPNTGYQFIGWATTSDATEADAGTAGATYYPTANITLYAVYNEVYTINYMVNGVNTNPQVNVEEGTALVFPEVSAPDADHVFRGWVTEAIEGTTDTEPDYVNITGLTATQNITYYAVFAEKSEGEVTWNIANDIAANDVIIIATNKNYTDHDMKTAGTISNNIMSCKASTFNSDKTQITSVADGTLEFTLGGNSTSGWTLQNGTNYLGMSGDKKVALSSTSSTWTISFNNGVATVSQKYNNSNYSLQYNYNNGSDRFTGYTSNQVTISLYKKTQGITYSNFCTTVVTKVLTSISLSGDYPTVFWKGDAFSHEGMTVTAHYDDESTKDVTSSATFSTPDMTTVGEQTVTVTYDTKSATYDITVKTIANTQETAYTTAEAIALIDANPAELATTEVYVKGTVSNIVTAFDANYGNISFDVSEDGETTGQQFRFYRNFKGADKTKWASAEECPAVGDDVIGCGTMTKYNSVYEYTEGNYLVSHIKASTLSIENVTVEIDGDIVPVIETNVVGDYTISYTSDNEEVVLAVDDEMTTIGLGEATITATLTADGYKEATTTFEVEVIKALTSITVATEPTVTSYKVGDVFDPTGLVITATYSDETTEDIAYEGNEDKFTFEPSLETELTTDITSVTITYAGKETTQEITVRALYTYNITWMANGEQFTITQVTEDNTLALPETSPDNIGDFVFKGWTATESYFNETTAPEYIVPAEIVPKEAMTLYAVYAKEHKDIQEMTSTMDFSEETYSDWTVDEKITRTADQGTGGTGDYAGKINTNDSYITFNDKVKVESFGFSFKRTSNNENYYVYIETSTDNETWEPRQTYLMKDFGNGSYTTKTDDTFDGETEMYVRFHCSNTTAIRYVDDVIIKYIGEDITYSNFCTTVAPIVISENTVWDGNVTINGNTIVTIESGAVLTVTGTLTNSKPENLVIEDGGQLIFNNADGSKDDNINSGVKATVEKNIVPYGSSKGDKGWHFLAAPMTDFAVESFINQANGNYDLYRWYIKDNGDPIWYNYKAHTSDFETNFVSGRGYLAAYQTTDLLEMKGTLNAGTEFEFTNELNSKGNFTLLGNPFTYDLNWSEFTMTDVYNGFAVVDSEDGIIKYAVGDTKIKVGTGFMVYSEKDGAELSFTKGSGSGKSNDILALNLFASNGNGEDNTIIVLDDKNGGFAKADNFNTNVSQIYTERLQTKYGIRNFNTNTKEFNVSFKAAGEGSNTIRLETIGEFDYVHLYDKLLDVDVDMLLEGSYTFEASEDDDTHRFIVRIDKGNTGINENDNENENFVNVYNGEIHVSGVGEVQIFDVMGRMVHSEVLSGDATISTSNIKGGIYVVRLIGDGWTKAEKIVVRR